MKITVILMSVLFSNYAKADRLDAESSFYIGKGVSIMKPYYETSDGTRHSINLKNFNGQPTPELAHLCSMYTHTPVNQILAYVRVDERKGGMAYDVNGGFSAISYPNTNKYNSIYSLSCFSNQNQLIPLDGKTTYSPDGSITVEFPTTKYNGKTYLIYVDIEKDADSFCRLLGYSTLEAAKISLTSLRQELEVVQFSINFDNGTLYFPVETQSSNGMSLFFLESFTCKP